VFSKKHIFILGSFFSGIIFLLFFRGAINFVVNFPFGRFNHKKDYSIAVGSKNIKIFYWKDEFLNFEEVRSIWGNDDSENLKYVVKNWLSVVYENRVVGSHINLEVATSSINLSDGIISFDKSFLSKDSSIQSKYKLVESILKTIKNSGIKIQKVYFFVKNEFLDDEHLDFSHPWPI